MMRAKSPLMSSLGSNNPAEPLYLLPVAEPLKLTGLPPVPSSSYSWLERKEFSPPLHGLRL